QDNGGNFSAGLDRPRDEHPERGGVFNEEVRTWLPEYDHVFLETPRAGAKAFSLRTRYGKPANPPDQLSPGSLLALGLLVLAYIPNPPLIVGLEEPDHGLHPRLLRYVKDALYRLSYPESCGETRPPVQVIATSHSPYLLDLFRDHPEEVVIV